MTFGHGLFDNVGASFQADTQQFAARDASKDVAPDGGKGWINVDWRGTHYWWKQPENLGTRGYTSTGSSSADSVVSWLRNTLAITKGYGIQFLSLAPHDKYVEPVVKAEVGPGEEGPVSLGTTVVSDDDTRITSTDEQNEIDATDDSEDDGEVECKTEDCPPNHIAVKSTHAGIETCSCQSTQALGEGVKAVGKGLGMIALAGLATTGIVVYGLYRVIRG